jgi:hypothetical protein
VNEIHATECGRTGNDRADRHGQVRKMGKEKAMLTCSIAL